MRNHWLQKSWKLAFEVHDSELGQYVLVKKGPYYTTFQIEVLKNAKTQFNLTPEKVMTDLIVSELEYGLKFPPVNQIIKLSLVEKVVIYMYLKLYRWK